MSGRRTATERAPTDGPPPQRLDVEALHERLCDRIAELPSLVVADITRVFLEVSSLACDEMLWSLEFAFDEDDSRIARLEARFAKKGAAGALGDEVHGYDVHVLLPKVLPPSPPGDELRAATRAPGSALAPDSLVARFVRALADLGAYRTIEMLEACSAEVFLA